MKFLSRLDDFEHIVIDGSVSGTGLSSLYLKDTATPILRIGNNTGDAFITYDGSELSISSDVDLRFTTPTDQDVFLITSSGNISTTAAGGIFTIGGGLTLPAITGGFLKTDANGVVSVDNSSYLTNETDTLDSVTDRGNTTTNDIGVGAITLSQSSSISGAMLTHYTNNYVYLRGGTEGAILSDNSGNNTIQVSGAGNYIRFETSNGSERMRITNTGNVGIGTTAPNALLSISKTISSDTRFLEINNAGNNQFRSDIDFTVTSGGITVGRISSIYPAGNNVGLSFSTYGTSPSTGLHERMRINGSNGKVGIGTTDPGLLLEVNSNSTSAEMIRARYNASYYTDYGSNNMNFTGPSQTYQFRNNGSAAITINSSSNVGIGTTSPTQKLTVEDTIGIKRAGVAAVATIQQTGAGTEINAPSGYHPLIIKHNGSELARFKNDGNVGIGTTSPDYKLDIDYVDTSISSNPTLRVRNAWTTEGNNIGFSNKSLIIVSAGNDTVVTKMQSRYDSGANIGQIGTTTDHDFLITTNNLERLRLDTSGNLQLPAYGAGILTTDASGNVSLDTSTYLTSYTETQTLDDVTTLGATTTNAITVGDITSTGDITIDNSSGDPFLKFKTTAQEYVVRIDQSDSEKFQIRDTTNSATRLTIDTSGNVGIGTTSPVRPLHIHRSATSTDVRISLTDGTTGAGTDSGFDIIKGTGQNAYLWNYSNASMRFGTNASERMRITSDGRVGIGTTNPTLSPTSYTGALHVENDTYIQARLSSSSSGAGLEFIPSSGDHWEIQAQTGNSLIFYNRTDGSYRLVIDGGGNIGVGITSPAAKMHIGPDALVSGYTTTRTTLAVSDVTNGAELILRGQSPRIWFDATSAGNGEIYMDGVSLDILSGTPISAGSSRFNIDSSGNIQFGAYGAGLLQTDASGNVSVDTTTYIPTTDYDDFVNVAGDTMTGNLLLGDSIELRLGTDTDLKIYHDGTVGRIANNTGHLYIQNLSDDKDIYLRSDDGAGGLSTYLSIDGSNSLVNITKPLTLSNYGAGILKTDANGVVSVDTSAYLTSYTETQTLDDVTDLGATTTNSITVGQVTIDKTADNTKIAFNSHSTLQGATAEIGVSREDFSTSKSQMSFYTNNGSGLNLAMRIKESGKIGIGTTNPGSILHIQGDGSGILELTRNSGTPHIFFKNTANTGYGRIYISDDLFQISAGTSTKALDFAWIQGDSNGNIAFPQYGAGLLQTDASGNISVDTNTYLTAEADTLSTVTARGATASVALSLGTESATSGSLVLTDRYVGDDHIANIGWIQSSGGTYIGYGVKQDGSSDWKSTFDNFSGKRNYLAIDEDSIKIAYSGAVQTAVGSAVTLSEKFRFDLANGRLGIGTTNPTTLLELKSTTVTAGLCITSANNAYSDINLGDVDDVNIQRIRSEHSSNSLLIYTNNSEQMRINSSGNVGIGTTLPDTKLQVAATGSVGLSVRSNTSGDAYMRLYSDATIEADWFIDRSASTINFRTVQSKPLVLATDNTEAMRIDVSQNVGIGTTPSSWGTGFLGLDLGGSTAANIGGGARTRFASNLYYDGSNFKYKNNYGGSYYFQDAVNINHTWGTAVTGTGGATATLVERMRLSSAGNLGIGTTNPTQKLTIGQSGDTVNYIRVIASTTDLYLGSNSNDPHLGVTNGAKILQTNSYPLVIGTTANQELFLGANNAKIATLVDGKFGIGTTTPATLLHVVGTAETRLRVGSSNASSNVVLELRDENTPTGQGTVITYNNSTGETYFNNALSTATTDFHFQSGEYGTASDFFTLSNSGGNAILHLKTTSGDSFITYEDSTNELAVASDGDLRLTTPTDQDVFLISSGGNIDMTQAGGTVDMGGNLVVDGDGIFNSKVDIGTATVATPNAAADDLHIKSSGSNGITISSGNAHTGTIFFGDGVSSVAAGFRYNHNTGDMAISAEDNITFTCDNVGIGTTSPGSTLHVDGTVRFVNSGFAGFEAHNTNGTWESFIGTETGGGGNRYNSASSQHTFYNSSSAVMRINSSGNVGIGTTAPQQALHIKGATNGLMMLEGDNDNGIAGCYYKTEDTDDTMNRTKGFFGFQGNNTWGLGYFTMWLDNVGDNGTVTASEERFRWERDGDFHADGDVIAYSTTTPSDIRLKTDIETIESASEKVSKLRGVEYTWSKGKLAGQREIGLIAQEVEAVVPEVVKEKKLPLWDDSGESYKTVDYDKLVALLIESNKEMQEEIKQLKERLDGFTK